VLTGPEAGIRKHMEKTVFRGKSAADVFVQNFDTFSAYLYDSAPNLVFNTTAGRQDARMASQHDI
jgi:hypothetical protein